MNTFVNDLKREFKGYNTQRFLKDLLAGFTVAAVALPLALAFGVSSGADAAAGMITAIIAGIVIGGLSGASYQISGPTGAMSAILIGLSATYGLQGVFVASLMSGIILMLASVFKVGRIVSFIPSSVVTGFTSGIAIIIAAGQIDNFFGTTSSGTNLIEKLASYGQLGFSIDGMTLLFGAMVVGIMIIWPKKWQSVFPSSLAAILIALTFHMLLPYEVKEVGAIPSTLLPDVRLFMNQIPWSNMQNLIMPAVSIAALGMIESLLCGASASKMKNEPLHADRELLAQGIGNTILPFFGGVPATAAIARTSVAIKAGGQTRLVSMIHSLVLLASMFLLGPYMSKIPMAALAGVLMMTAWRMNEWREIHHMFDKKLKTNLAQFFTTMIATIVFDLTIAIFIGILVSCILFIVNNSDLSISVEDVDFKRLDKDLKYSHEQTKLIYLSGPMFFATQGKIKQVLKASITEAEALIFSMRGVPSIDQNGVQELNDIATGCKNQHIRVILCGVNASVMNQLERYEILESFDNIVWDAIEAITYLDGIYHEEERQLY